jgi:DNA-binding GntR family transcriptional regulator
MPQLIVRSLADQLVDVVRERILSGSVPADGAIRQEALATELGVSNIPLREALRRLEQEGLVHSRVNRGWFVAPLGAEEAEEVFALRMKLEPDSVALAAERANEQDRALAIAALAALDATAGTHDGGVGTLNRAFHLALVRPAAQPIVTTMLERLHVLSQRYVRADLQPRGRDQRSIDEHHAMLTPWLARDGEGAAKACHAHIRRTIRDLRRRFAARDGMSV